MPSAGAIDWTEVTTGIGSTEDPVRVYEGEWLSDGSGNAVGTTPQLNGSLLQVAFDPGSPAPGSNYDVAALNSFGIDVFGSVGTNLSATVSLQDTPVTTAVAPFILAGTLAVTVSGVGAADKVGKIRIYVR